MHSWFNRKSTAFQQALEDYSIQLENLEKKVDRQLASNKADLLEFAELSEKTRRLYLRLTRRAKIDQEAASSKDAVGELDNHENPAQELTPREIRDRINSSMRI